MPLAFNKERKQNEKNSLLDFRLQGTQLTLHSRPHSSSRSISRIETAYRAMSATPTLYHQEKHRKTPSWMRPQSADHLSSRNNPRRKLAAKFDGARKPGKNSRKAGGSMSNLLESSSMEDVLDSETSVTPSPVPSLTEVLRTSTKLEPGLAAKPPIPPVGGAVAKKNKSMDDIINIKFQRWFPESVQNASPYTDTIAAMTNGSEMSLSNNDNTQSDAMFVAELMAQSSLPDTNATNGTKNEEIARGCFQILTASSLRITKEQE
uniref:Uncharacterized protein n=2 Tax=Lygus hesperus TaxID=30085 RepID=A0A0K8TD98_LYGHE